MLRARRVLDRKALKEGQELLVSKEAKVGKALRDRRDRKDSRG